ncbi:MAG: hypothetical protein KAS07_00805 [Candidatus Pacebacteria bacterium]|nr:hypothetical protein [Candidatus Paceibacterota bacterium]
MLAKSLGISSEEVNVIFTQPFLVDKVKIADDIDEVYVVDIAVNNRDVEMTKKFITKLGDKLVKWYDHHEGWHTTNEKFLHNSSSKSCAELIFSEITEGLGNVPTDPDEWAEWVNTEWRAYYYDWMMFLVSNANVADTRKGKLSERAQLIENACKASIQDDSIRVAAVKWLLEDENQKSLLETAAEKYAVIQKETKRLATTYEVDGNVAFVNTRKGSTKAFDLTQLLLEGQKKAAFAVAVTVDPRTSEKIITVATQSDKNLVDLFGLPSGAPFRVTLPVARLEEALKELKNLN